MSDRPRRFREMLEDFQQFTVDVIYSRRHDGWAQAWGGFLHVLSLGFHGIVRLRAWLYRERLLRPSHLGCQVIVVGNLTVGGTGKTPVVEKLARSLRDRGRKVAILSRGYKSKAEPLYKKWWRELTHGLELPPRIVSDGERVLLDSEVAGDEPFMLAKNLPGVCVITDKDRVKAGLYAIRRFGVDTLILDDGFQYFKLADSFQLLLVDQTNPFGNGHVLPRGILREPIHHMSRASYVFVTKSDGAPPRELVETIQQHRPGAELISCTHAPQDLRAVNGAEHDRLPLTILQGKRIMALSAIAVPESFESILQKHGAAIIRRHRFLDHHRFERWELEDVYAEARRQGLDFLVTTEKDAVRIPPDWNPEGLAFYYLRVEIEILSGVSDFEEAVSRICLEPRVAHIPTQAEGALR